MGGGGRRDPESPSKKNPRDAVEVGRKGEPSDHARPTPRSKGKRRGPGSEGSARKLAAAATVASEGEPAQTSVGSRMPNLKSGQHRGLRAGGKRKEPGPAPAGGEGSPWGEKKNSGKIGKAKGLTDESGSREKAPGAGQTGVEILPKA